MKDRIMTTLDRVEDKIQELCKNVEVLHVRDGTKMFFMRRAHRKFLGRIVAYRNYRAWGEDCTDGALMYKRQPIFFSN